MLIIRVLLAEKKEKYNTKFISGQHGGSFFTAKFSFFERHQSEISDLFLTWGHNKKKCKPLFNFKTANKKVKKQKKASHLHVSSGISCAMSEIAQNKKIKKKPATCTYRRVFLPLCLKCSYNSKSHFWYVDAC